MRRFFLSALLVSIAMIGFGCNDTICEPDPPAKAALHEDLLEELKLPRAPENHVNATQEIEYHIIMDSRIASSNSRSGFLRKNCVTLQNILSCLQTSVSGKGYKGYYTGKAKVYDSDPVSGKQVEVGVTNYSLTNNLFSQASCAKFSSTDLLPSETIVQIASEVTEKSVYVFVTDLAMPNAGESAQIISALSERVLTNNNLTVGLIGALADYCGTVLDIPISKVGVDLPPKGHYQKPVYLLLVGQKDAVYELMDTFLYASESNNSLNQTGQMNALYYRKYEFATRKDATTGEVQEAATVKNTGCLAKYMVDQYNPSNIFKMSAEDSEWKDVLSNLPFSKIYSGIKFDKNMTSDKGNLQFSFEIPYKIQSMNESAKSELMKKVGDISLSELSPTLNTELYRIAFHEDASELVVSKAEPVSSDELYIDANTAKSDPQSERWTVSGNYNASKLELDNPVIYSVRMTFNCKAPSQLLEKSYDTAWLKQWQMDLDKLQKNWGSESNIGEALKTPYLADIFGNALLNANTTAVQKYISDFSTQYVNGINFGVVLREQALHYNNEGDWEDDEDFGWAFSKSAVDIMLKD